MRRSVIRHLSSFIRLAVNDSPSWTPTRLTSVPFSSELAQQYTRHQGNRSFSTERGDERATEKVAKTGTSKEKEEFGEEQLETELPGEEAGSGQETSSTATDHKDILQERDAALKQLSIQLDEERKKVLLGLAEAENLRNRFQRESSQTKKFAVQGFVQSLLGCLDNLDRAIESLPDEFKGQNEKAQEPEKALKALKGLTVGVQMTQSEFRNVLQAHGVTRYDPIGELFNPNEHMARFELDDPSKKPGTVGVVTLCGYKMHERIIRPAEVGVIRKREEDTSTEAEEKSESGS